MVAIPDELEARFPRRSLEKWPTSNCAEVAAGAKAIKAGFLLEDLIIGAVRTRDGSYFPPCKNCRWWTTPLLPCRPDGQRGSMVEQP